MTTNAWKLVWQDDFSGDGLDTNKWTPIVSGGGFGNNELQYYTDRKKNVFVEDGKLVLRAHREDYKGHAFTSGKLKTQHKGDWTYGRFEIRAKFPQGQGFWPAVWMMPTDESKYGGWPVGGEIDIIELVGNEPGRVHGTLHFGNTWKNVGGGYDLPDGTTFADDFHDFALEWMPGRFDWFVDGTHYLTLTNWYTSAPDAMWPAPFDQDFYLQLNLAVGGNWPGSPDETTVFPGQLEVDEVRVYAWTGKLPTVPVRRSTPELQAARPALPDDNLIYDGEFRGVDEWDLGTHAGGKGRWTATGNVAHVRIDKPGDQAWSVQLMQQPLHMEKGRSYELAFRTKAERPRKLMFHVGKASQHWDSYSGRREIEVGTSWQDVSHTFAMRFLSDPVARLEFNLGLDDADVWIADVSLRAVAKTALYRVQDRLRIQAEAYDAAEGVEMEACREGGSNIAYLEPKDWVLYRLAVEEAGDFDLVLRYAAESDGAIAVQPGDESPATTQLEQTGGWQNWRDQVMSSIFLPSGSCDLRLTVVEPGFNLNWIELIRRTGGD